MVAPIVLTTSWSWSTDTPSTATPQNGRTFRIAATGVAAMSLLLVGQTLLGFFGVG